VYSVTFRRVRLTIVAVEKQCFTYSVCVFLVLIIYNAKRRRRIILQSADSLALKCFPTFSRKRHYFRKKKEKSYRKKMCMDC
jgi:hypothetical protein